VHVRGALKVLTLDNFLETFELLEAARFLIPLVGPARAQQSDLLEMPSLLLQVSAEKL
jgi:hypothetical protein